MKTAHQPPQCSCIDIHTHAVPHDFPAYSGSYPDAPWPSMPEAKPCHRHVVISSRVYRAVSNQAWDIDVRRGDMDRLDVWRQVLSPMPELPFGSTLQTVQLHNKRYLTAIDIVVKERETVMRELALMGVAAGALFPGLDGSCEELRERLFPT